MADKLSETTWVSFTKKRKLELDDAALVKALAKFDKTDAAKPEPLLDALESVVDQAKKQVAALVKRKKELGDKPFGEIKDKLHELLDAAEKLQAETRAAEKAKSAKKDADDDDEADSPALLTSKMLPLLRELRKGEVVMQALIAVAGKETVVLVSRRAISPARGKLLKEQMTSPSGLKFIRGECLLEDKLLTFVVQAGAAGLARKIKAALFEQTGLRLNIRVRGEDGADEEGGVEGDGDGDAEGASSGAAPGLVAGATSGGRPESDQPAQPSPDKLRYIQRMEQLEPRYLEALRAQHSEASRLRALMSYVVEKADEMQDYAAAAKGLDGLERVLDGTSASPDAPAAVTPAATAATPATPSPGASAKPVSLVVLQQSRLVWEKARKVANVEIDALKKAILEAARDDPDLDEIVDSISMFDELKSKFDERLIDKLDEALNATDPDERAARNREAAVIIRQHQASIASDELVKNLAGNPFLSVNVEKTLTTTLAMLAAKLGA